MSLAVELIQGSPEWLAWRNSGIGGSDAPAVEGISPYKTRLEIYKEKTGTAPAQDDSNEFIFAKGHKVEGLIRKEFQELTRAEMKPVCLVHPKFDYIRASLDGLDSKLGVLEAKLVGQDVLKAARDGGIPAHHFSQIQHQLEVSGADVAQWFGHDGKKNGVLIEIKADKEYIKRLLEIEHRFWDDVKHGRAPELCERDYLTPDDETLLRELRDAKELMENSAAHFEALKDKIVKLYNHPKISGGGLKLFKVERKGSLSLLKVPEIADAAEKIQATLSPAYLEQFRTKGSESWTVRIDEKVEVKNG